MPTIAALRKEVARLKATLEAGRQTETPLLEKLRNDPATVLTTAGITPDDWQAKLMRSSFQRAMLLCSRQVGKSVVSGAIALRLALVEPRALVIVLSASERQAKEFLQTNVVDLWETLGRPVGGEATATTLRLNNRSRIIALPDNEKTVRVYAGVRMIVIDEAAQVSDELYFTVLPMLAVRKGRLLALSTPFGKRGWFYSAWTGPEDWERVGVPASACKRLTPEFLEEMRHKLGDHWYAQEFCMQFVDLISSLFREEDILAAFNCDVEPLALPGD
jgi:hypothetical protein